MLKRASFGTFVSESLAQENVYLVSESWPSFTESRIFVRQGFFSFMELHIYQLACLPLSSTEETSDYET